ncbi:MAG: PQQ-binding-like beta-propeller repeat protein, partial [Planctomycetes bacterium]|nr:PQQ-binding-like beta-propeller repeat protein [Planctomycetota bacterium]
LVKQGTIRSAGSWVLLTRGTLPGAGNWSHQYGEPGNTASSGDKLIKGGLGVLWYGDPGPDKMVNRHQGAVGPLVVDGRMFIQGTDSLMAYDAYNGLFLWEHANPKAVRTGVFQNRMPGNLAVGGDSLFHMIREKVIEHDAATGKIKATHSLPPSVDSKTHEWGYVAYKNGLLFGTATIREVIERQRRRRGNPGTASTDAIFAIDVKTGKHLWIHQGETIAQQTIALGPDRVFFIDSTITSQQREDILRQDKSELKNLKGEEAQRAEERMKKLDVRRAVALDARTGKQVWSEPVDVTDCSDIGIGGGKLTLMYANGVLLLGGANANGHYWKQFVSGEFKRRRLVALSAEDGYKLWSKDANYRHRPIIVGKRVIAEPWAFDLASGEQQMRSHPLTGEKISWSFMRPGHHCGMLTGSDNMLLFRSGFTGFYDLEADAGTRHFAGHRLGCWINAIPTNGLVVIPEASAGCVCMFSIASTIVMEPREPRRPWSLYSGVGSTTPVKQMALNFGAPGDRRDAHGKLWLAYPRPTPNPRLETSLDLSFKLETKFLSQGGFFSRDGDSVERSSSELAWVVSSGGRGLARCSIPLLGKNDKPANYTVRLHFSGEEADQSGQRIFDVRMQGKTVLQNVDVNSGAGGSSKSQSHEVTGVEVTDNLVIELIPKSKIQDSSSLPILNGIEIQRVTQSQ